MIKNIWLTIQTKNNLKKSENQIKKIKDIKELKEKKPQAHIRLIDRHNEC